MKRRRIEAFRNPGRDCRGAPFWAWNGKLEPEELRRQIRIMHRMGLGGFFIEFVFRDTNPLTGAMQARLDEACRMVRDLTGHPEGAR